MSCIQASWLCYWLCWPASWSCFWWCWKCWRCWTQDDSHGQRKFKETPVPAVAEPVAPLRNVGALVPGTPSSSIHLLCQKNPFSRNILSWVGRIRVLFWAILELFNRPGNSDFLQELTQSLWSGQRRLWIRQSVNIRSLLSLDSITGGWCWCWCWCWWWWLWFQREKSSEKTRLARKALRLLSKAAEVTKSSS